MPNSLFFFSHNVTALRSVDGRFDNDFLHVYGTLIVSKLSKVYEIVNHQSRHKFTSLLILN